VYSEQERKNSMAKRKKTFSQLKKESLEKKREKEFESLCRRCGLCCHIKIGLSDGTYVIHPTITCKYLTEDNLCSIYNDRLHSDSAICFNREEMINKDYLLPEGCPYTKLRPGYKTARIVTQAEFDDIVNRELEAGNYNVLLANRAF
jgi:uncharacterized cysteine cluster protein YcgN (CxxCxxCC family)